MNTTHYPFQAIEQKWRASWEQLNLYQADDNADKPRYYVLDFFPYPSGAGLSVGHCRNYVPTCVDARFHRMRGYNVLHPMGWDAFGLPAENYAIAHHIHPRDSTKLFTDTYRRQMKLVECSYDWSREINSTDPDYYRWTQWFFLLLHRRGLAYHLIFAQIERVSTIFLQIHRVSTPICAIFTVILYANHKSFKISFDLV